PGAVFEPFRAGRGGGRLVGFGLLMSALYLLVFGVLVGTLGEGLPEWYAQVMQLQVEAAGRPIQPGDLPDPPPGLGKVLGLGLLGCSAWACRRGAEPPAGRSRPAAWPVRRRGWGRCLAWGLRLAGCWAAATASGSGRGAWAGAACWGRCATGSRGRCATCC